jgi:predicted extracellular nuclease
MGNETIHTIAFYNIENLFDVHNDENTHDEDFLPDSDKRWTLKRYHKKLRKIGYAISNIGLKESGKHPVLVGLAEIENASVLSDLIASKHIETCPYDFVHYDSKDERGIDVALLYDKTVFKVHASEVFHIELFQESGQPDYTRDILLVSGELDGDYVHILVNHWSSRREGTKETEYKRITASNKLISVIDSLKQKDKNAQIIILGDFNDDPSSTSIKQLVLAADLFNPMVTLRSYNRGTSNHNRQWNLFDQILFTTNLFEREASQLSFMNANIFDEDFLKLYDGKYKGSPYRTYVGSKYKGGYSDHFPVYITLKKL